MNEMLHASSVQTFPASINVRQGSNDLPPGANPLALDLSEMARK